MNSTLDKNIFYKTLIFFIILLILLGQVFFIMNVLAHSEEIEQENQKLTKNNQKLIENYQKIQYDNKIINHEQPSSSKNSNINENKNISVEKIILNPLLKSLKDNIDLQKKFFQPQTTSFKNSFAKLTDEATQSLIVFKNTEEEKIDHIQYFNKFGELISKIYLNDKTNNYKTIEEYENNQLLRKITLSDDSQLETTSFYMNNQIQNEIFKKYDEKTKTFAPFQNLEYDKTGKIIKSTLYQQNYPYVIEKNIYFHPQIEEQVLKIERFKYINNVLDSVEELDQNQRLLKITFYSPENKINMIKTFNYEVPKEILAQTIIFDKNGNTQTFSAIEQMS